MQQRYVDPDGMGKRDSVCGGYGYPKPERAVQVSGLRTLSAG